MKDQYQKLIHLLSHEAEVLFVKSILNIFNDKWTKHMHKSHASGFKNKQTVHIWHNALITEGEVAVQVMSETDTGPGSWYPHLLVTYS